MKLRGSPVSLTTNDSQASEMTRVEKEGKRTSQSRKKRRLALRETSRGGACPNIQLRRKHDKQERISRAGNSAGLHDRY